MKYRISKEETKELIDKLGKYYMLEELAVIVGKNYMTIHRWSHGKNRISKCDMDVLNEALKRKIEEEERRFSGDYKTGEGEENWKFTGEPHLDSD